MKNKIFRRGRGFSLIELSVVIGIISVLFYGAYIVGVPEYNRYILDAQIQSQVDELLENRSRALATGQPIATSSSFMDGQVIIDQNGFINGR